MHSVILNYSLSHKCGRVFRVYWRKALSPSRGLRSILITGRHTRLWAVSTFVFRKKITYLLPETHNLWRAAGMCLRPQPNTALTLLNIPMNQHFQAKRFYMDIPRWRPVSCCAVSVITQVLCVSDTSPWKHSRFTPGKPGLDGAPPSHLLIWLRGHPRSRGATAMPGQSGCIRLKENLIWLRWAHADKDHIFLNMGSLRELTGNWVILCESKIRLQCQ